MFKTAEELKMVLDLAESKGRKEAENESLKAQIKKLEEENARLLILVNEKDKQLAEKDRRIEDLKQNAGNVDRLMDTVEKMADRPEKQEIIYGDKVGEKNMIPSVSNFRPEIYTQNMNMPLPPEDDNNQNILEDE
ncbi:hypothetical protein [uncultured Prevotella sp.]|uniref:hypothetical protein n=1 Tax=uncultured Prevotella sp. TaxID=159272 RepID=UPI00258E473A|nr:hypothetical protein [uncultured Prevotella sp.]